MSEVSTTLTVIAAVLFVIVQGLGVASFVMLLMQGRRMKELADKNTALAADNEKLKRGQRVTAKLAQKLRKGQLKQTAKQATDKTEVVDGQMKLAELLTAGAKAQVDFLNAMSKAQTDSIFDAVTKNGDDILKLNTENSQKVYDAVVIMIQMMNNLMTAMGYRPAAPTPEESGLEDPKKGQNYNKPPAEVDQDGLTYNR